MTRPRPARLRLARSLPLCLLPAAGGVAPAAALAEPLIGLNLFQAASWTPEVVFADHAQRMAPWQGRRADGPWGEYEAGRVVFDAAGTPSRIAPGTTR